MLFGTSKKRVLVIDDDPSLMRLLHIRLEMHENVEVIEATDGKSGLVQADTHKPDLIILDWMLPDIQGIEVLAQLKLGHNTKNTPILMLSGKNMVGNIEDAFDLGAEAYMTKPVSLQKLGEKVRSLLDPPNIK